MKVKDLIEQISKMQKTGHIMMEEIIDIDSADICLWQTDKPDKPCIFVARTRKHCDPERYGLFCIIKWDGKLELHDAGEISRQALRDIEHNFSYLDELDYHEYLIIQEL